MVVFTGRQAVTSSSGATAPSRPGSSMANLSSSPNKSTKSRSSAELNPPTSSMTSRLTAPTIASAARSGASTPIPSRSPAIGAKSLLRGQEGSSSGRSTPVGGAAARKTVSSASKTLKHSTSMQKLAAAAKMALPRVNEGKVLGSHPAKQNPTPFLRPTLSAGPRDPIQAFLRIRPAPEESKMEYAEPYIQVLSPTEVVMNPPTEPGLPRSRIHSTLPSTRYTFANVFGPDKDPNNSQAAFFQSTTLPMVTELLQGESGLIFTYGVTNSGKSYTVQGGTEPGEAGLLPRALDVVFNSIEGLESDSEIIPIGLYGVTRAPMGGSAQPNSPTSLDPWAVPSINKRLAAEVGRRNVTPTSYQRETTKIKVDRNYRYSVWVSYVEVYNEKLFDLLDVGGSTAPAAGGFGGMSRSDSVRGSNWSIAGGLSSMGTVGDLSTLAAQGGPITLNRRALNLKTDPEGGGKYVAGLREVRISSVPEARELLKKGQENRIVFGTMANRTSSRSHGVFTIKVVREHAGSSADESLCCSVSRLSIVDLAGSERISNTLSSGDRRKEAGSINKSLMCLGQCLETLRKNQARAANVNIPSSIPLAASKGFDADSSARPSTPSMIPVIPPKSKRRPSVVPFRHSKLTELFQPFFTGEGRTVMIVNANPYDTGFDENSNVMKFAAVAREVQTGSNEGSRTEFKNVPKIVTSRLPFPSSGSDGGTPPASPRAANKLRAGLTPASRFSANAPPTPSRLSQSTSAPAQGPSGKNLSQEITIIEESDEEDMDGEDEHEEDPFVDLLIQRHDALLQRLHDAELRCATIESSIREEMANEMATRLLELEQRYTERLLNDQESNEDFLNRKIDLLVKANQEENVRRKEKWLLTPRPAAKGFFGTSPAKRRVVAEEDEMEVDDSLGPALDRSAEADESVNSDQSISLQPGPLQVVGDEASEIEEEEEDEEEEDGGEEEEEEEEEDMQSAADLSTLSQVPADISAAVEAGDEQGDEDELASSPVTSEIGVATTESAPAPGLAVDESIRSTYDDAESFSQETMPSAATATAPVSGMTTRPRVAKATEPSYSLETDSSEEEQDDESELDTESEDDEEVEDPESSYVQSAAETSEDEESEEEEVQPRRRRSTVAGAGRSRASIAAAVTPKKATATPARKKEAASPRAAASTAAQKKKQPLTQSRGSNSNSNTSVSSLLPSQGAKGSRTPRAAAKSAATPRAKAKAKAKLSSSSSSPSKRSLASTSLSDASDENNGHTNINDDDDDDLLLSPSKANSPSKKKRVLKGKNSSALAHAIVFAEEIDDSVGVGLI